MTPGTPARRGLAFAPTAPGEIADGGSGKSSGGPAMDGGEAKSPDSVASSAVPKPPSSSSTAVVAPPSMRRGRSLPPLMPRAPQAQGRRGSSSYGEDAVGVDTNSNQEGVERIGGGGVGERESTISFAEPQAQQRLRFLSDLTDSMRSEVVRFDYDDDDTTATGDGSSASEDDDEKLDGSLKWPRCQPPPPPAVPGHRQHDDDLPPTVAPSFSAADVALSQAAAHRAAGGELIVDERLTLADLTPSITDEVEAALIDALDRREEAGRVRDEMKKQQQQHRRVWSTGIPLEAVPEDAASAFLNHFEEEEKEEEGDKEAEDKVHRATDSGSSPLRGEAPQRNLNGATKPTHPGSLSNSLSGSVKSRDRRKQLHVHHPAPIPPPSPPRPQTKTPPSSPNDKSKKGHRKHKSRIADLADQLRDEHRGGVGTQGGDALKKLEQLGNKTKQGQADINSKHDLRGSALSAATKGGRLQRKDPSSRRSVRTGKEVDGGSSGASTDYSRPRPSPPESSVDLMYKHASILFNRRPSSSNSSGLKADHDSGRCDDCVDLEAGRGEAVQQDDEADKKKQQGAARANANWGRLRQTVHATGAFVAGAVGGQQRNDEEERESSTNDDGTDDGEEAGRFGGGRDGGGDEEEDSGTDGNGRSHSNGKLSSIQGKMRGGNVVTRTCWWVFYRFRIVFQLRRQVRHFLLYTKKVMLWLGVPLLGVAAILFYLAPPDPAGPMTKSTGASWSWWLIFIFRQVMTLSLGRGTQYFFVDCICLRSKVALKVFGPAITLGMVQSRGWPFILNAWALWDFAILQGDHDYTNHWLFWQEPIKMYNANNPSGDVLASKFYMSLLIASVVVGILTAVKRAVVSFHLGAKTCDHYGPQLEDLMKEMILLSSVANLAKEIERSQEATRSIHANNVGLVPTALYVWQDKVFHRRETYATTNNGDNEGVVEIEVSDDTTTCGRERLYTDETTVVTEPPSTLLPSVDKLRMSEKNKLLNLLDQWEEPSNLEDNTFRQALATMDTAYPFSVAFGEASSRKEGIESAQQVYRRLLSRTPNESVLSFETISIVALNDYGELEVDKTKALVRLFRPDRNGKLSLLDFVKSCDGIYKKLRMLRASVANFSAINNAYEKIINAGFYFVLAIIVLLILRIDPWATLLALSSLIVSFAFAFGSAVSKFTEGVLLVTVRKPYDIGDRIHISDPNQDTNSDGTSTWFVENITLFTTTLRFATTNEVCTIANGSLANSRIVNGARSPKALVYVYLKFGIEVPYEKVKFFRSTVESFVKSRPREWGSLSAFRATRVQADLGYIEYVVVLQHREAWQNIGPILNSKAELSSFCLEVSKKLGMRYIAPPLPVQLEVDRGAIADFPSGLFGASTPAVDRKEEGQHPSTSFISLDELQASGLEAVKDLFKVKENKEKKKKRPKRNE